MMFECKPLLFTHTHTHARTAFFEIRNTTFYFNDFLMTFNRNSTINFPDITSLLTIELNHVFSQNSFKTAFQFLTFIIMLSAAYTESDIITESRI